MSKLSMNQIDYRKLISELKHLYIFNKDNYHELKVIHENYDLKNIVKIMVNLDHDGYDEYGPESDLWYLIIVHKKEDKIYTSCWHRENWFSQNADDEYFLEKEYCNI